MNTFYDLKMEHGEPVDLYYGVNNTFDVETGVKTQTKTKVVIKRAIVSSLASKYKFFSPAESTYQRDDTVVLIDYRDLTYTLGKEDYFVIAGKKYLIVSVEYVKNDGYIFVIRHVQNEPPLQVVTINMRHGMYFDHESETEFEV